MNRRWSGAIAVEGKWTEDGRLIEPGAIELDALVESVYVVDLARGTFLGSRIVGTVETLRREPDGVVIGEGSIDWPTPARITSVAIELREYEATRTRDDRLTISGGRLVRVCVNSQAPSWAETVGITVL